MNSRTASLLLIALLTTIALSQEQAARNQIQPNKKNIVFVCEHGAALSVVSAAYFNKFAREQHLDMHAIARGVTAQENISATADAGLKKDGVPYETKQPQTLTEDDLDHADYVVTFLPLPEKYVIKLPMERWYDVVWAPGGYDKARDGIVNHLQQLMTKLKSEPQAR